MIFGVWKVHSRIQSGRRNTETASFKNNSPHIQAWPPRGTLSNFFFDLFLFRTKIVCFLKFPGSQDPKMKQRCWKIITYWFPKKMSLVELFWVHCQKNIRIIKFVMQCSLSKPVFQRLAEQCTAVANEQMWRDQVGFSRTKCMFTCCENSVLLRFSVER